jgi:hypothetical protein
VVALTLVTPETPMTLKTLKTLKTAVLPGVLLVASLGLACGDNTTSPTSTTTPTTDTFGPTTLYPAGADLETVNVSPGTISATLTSTTPPNVVLGFGIGLKSGNTCYLSASVNGQTGAQLSLPVDAGMYCIEVYDNGTLTDKVQFVLTITHP